MQSKVILTVTLALILIPAVYFFFCEFSWAPMKERVLLSLFQAVTPRTAGFNTADLTAMSETGQAITTLIDADRRLSRLHRRRYEDHHAGGAAASALAVFRQRENPQFFGRRVSHETVLQGIHHSLLMYLALFWGGGLVISGVEDLLLLSCLFERPPAVGTVGLSLGLTPELGAPPI